MRAEIYNSIPDEAITIRKLVFMQEQGFNDEFDDIDKTASHIVLYDYEIPIATARFFIKDGCYVVGRIAVVKEYRGKHVGADILRQVELCVSDRGGTKLKLHAQYDKRAFYEKQGYEAYGGIELEENCPHIWMCKKIK